MKKNKKKRYIYSSNMDSEPTTERNEMNPVGFKAALLRADANDQKKNKETDKKEIIINSQKQEKMENIYDYINSNLEAINKFTQDGFDWMHLKSNSEAEINGAAEKYTWFKDAVAILKNEAPILDRKKVRDYYEKDLYLGFIATILWGGSHTNHINNFRKMVGTPKETIVRNLNGMLADLKKDPAEGFKSMCRHERNHIDGLGVSFFTKVFYFTRSKHGQSNLLIMDGQLWNVAKAFRHAQKLPIQNYSVASSTESDYLEYCKNMNNVPEVNSAEQLEGFLFEHINEVKKLLPQQPTVNTLTPSKTSNNNKVKQAYYSGLFDQKENSEWFIRDDSYNFSYRTINGWRIKIDNIPFRIFCGVIGGKDPSAGKYYCELRNVSEKQSDQKNTNEIVGINRIINKYYGRCQNQRIDGSGWIPRNGNRLYTYIRFGRDTEDKIKALSLMKNIIRDDIEAPEEVEGARHEALNCIDKIIEDIKQ